MLTLSAISSFERQLTLLMVSHSVEDAANCARSIVVADGRIAVRQGKNRRATKRQASASALQASNPYFVGRIRRSRHPAKGIVSNPQLLRAEYRYTGISGWRISTTTRPRRSRASTAPDTSKRLRGEITRLNDRSVAFSAAAPQPPA